MAFAFITHPDCEQHDMGRSHPESAERLRTIRHQLHASGLAPLLTHYQAPLATRDQLLRAHTEAYVQSVFDEAPQQGHVYFDQDAVMSPGTLQAALRAAGAVVQGVDLVMTGAATGAFCSVRPPGHHAEHNRAMGFCFFNNIAVGATHALHVHNIERLAIVDFDVHHGNGTEDIFCDDKRVLYCSSFQHPFYPFSGADTRSDHMVMTPLAAGTDGSVFREAVTTHWLPALDAFRPQLIFCSAGFDAHREDGMALLRWDDEDYAWISRVIKQVAGKYAQGRVVSTLEGGYALPALGRSVVAHIRELM